MSRGRTGSSFDSFPEDEGTLEEATTHAKKRVTRWQKRQKRQKEKWDEVLFNAWLEYWYVCWYEDRLITFVNPDVGLLRMDH
jgi:hypothetical protein